MFFLKELPTQRMLQRYADRFPDMDVAKTDAALHMLRRASLLIRKLEQYFAEYGLSQTRFLILIVLDREGENQHFTMRDLVTRLDVSKVVISNTLKSLQKDGLARVSHNKSDGRAKNVAITTKGHEKLDAVLPGYYQLINQEMADENE